MPKSRVVRGPPLKRTVYQWESSKREEWTQELTRHCTNPHIGDGNVCCSVVVQILNDASEPIRWGRLHVGAERGISCDHFHQVPITNLPQGRREWQQQKYGDWAARGSQLPRRCIWLGWTSRPLSFDVAKPEVIAELLEEVWKCVECGGSQVGRRGGLDDQEHEGWELGENRKSLEGLSWKTSSCRLNTRIGRW